jgi:hypothetical protein
MGGGKTLLGGGGWGVGRGVAAFGSCGGERGEGQQREGNGW